jgi:hypothetical protein
MVAARSVGFALAAPAMAACLASVSCQNPVHDQEVAALGREQANVPPGPLHRPGRPCLTCHGGEGPASAQFSVGGTVCDLKGQSPPAVGAQVQVEDSTGKHWLAATNAAGNFYVAASEFTPRYPTQVTIASADGSVVQQMLTYVGRASSCADCHVNPESNTSPGPVYLNGN